MGSHLILLYSSGAIFIPIRAEQVGYDMMRYELFRWKSFLYNVQKFHSGLSIINYSSVGNDIPLISFFNFPKGTFDAYT